MAKVKSFKALRPAKGYGEKVAALPYDVMTSDEAREMVKGNPYSFLHIDKAEIDLPEGVGLYDPAVYAKAKENMGRMTAEGIFVQDGIPAYYIYRLTMNGRTQTGVVGCVSIDDYLNGAVKRHELMLAGKETDRINHVDTLDAQTGPIFLTCRPNDSLTDVISRVAAENEPLYDFTADDGVGHAIWRADGAAAAEIRGIFVSIPSLYIADGHHRCSAAIKVGEMRRAANPGYTGDEEFNYFLSVIFPADQLRIMDYNRVVSDLNGMNTDEFLSSFLEKFTLTACSGDSSPRPAKRHTFGLYVDGRWYALAAKPGTWDDADPVSRLDVSILQNNVLAPLLGIEDPRSDDRVDFVGGIRGLEGLEKRTRTDMKAAFAMFPPTMDDLMDVADGGLIMPPKSTWFEPKPRSGLLIHSIG
ncbi:MAG: DUF1015 family protein [Clostridiales Family XIII bacterium]|jgi:uncharacterized protein (DUF1015 family)|nr:DUF1015 family protein [Clostridiales Family XIII bacterium]